ncbi:MAG TPA: Ig-like domain-containing protein, partial [Saprospiraceae bacterium]|nr:Ig-like domain-containing protein [Saprospiraceae bacterium]
MTKWNACTARKWSLIAAILLMGCATGTDLWAQQEGVRVRLRDSTRVQPARPGDTISYQLKIDNLGITDTDTFRLQRSGDSNTTLIAGSFRSTPVAVPAVLSTPEDQALVITLQGIDPDGDVLTFQIVENPFSGNLNGLSALTATTARVVYQPLANVNGPDVFAFAVEDADGNRDTSEIRLTVQPVNDAPNFTPGGDVVV